MGGLDQAYRYHRSWAVESPVKRTSPDAAPVDDVLPSFMLTTLTDGRRFSHIERLREDATTPELFGKEAGAKARGASVGSAAREAKSSPWKIALAAWLQRRSLGPIAGSQNSCTWAVRMRSAGTSAR